MKTIFVPVNRYQNLDLDPKSNHHIVVVGAGPAGLMVADILSQSNFKVLLIDAMPSPGRKFLMAGRGGLNLTHSEDLSLFERRYRPDSQWMKTHLHGFTPAMTRQFMDELGAETFVGSSGRVFPRRLKASPLLRAWLERLYSQGVESSWGTRFLGFDDQQTLRVQRQGAIHKISFHKAVLAMGGASWPRLGSDGAWANSLSEIGVEITPFAPSNMGVIIKDYEYWRQKFKGQPLKSIKISFGEIEIKGEAMITNNGLEGGAIYAISGHLRDALNGSSPFINIDLKPEVSEATLIQKWEKYGPKTSVSNRLRKTTNLSEAAIGMILQAQKYHPNRSYPSLVKALPIWVTGVSGLERAISSKGGVCTTALNSDLSLKLAPNVFCVGEMIDWEAPTGGYLLQACFSIAHTCALGIINQQKSVTKP